MFLKAKKKKSSISGGAKKAIGDRFVRQFGVTLLFFGAGGHVKISGILNLFPFGVQHPFLLLASSSSSSSSPSILFEVGDLSWASASPCCLSYNLFLVAWEAIEAEVEPSAKFKLEKWLKSSIKKCLYIWKVRDIGKQIYYKEPIYLRDWIVYFVGLDYRGSKIQNPMTVTTTATTKR